MAIVTAVCESYKLELWQALHDFDNDTIKCALYTSSATLGASTTAYTASNEVADSGYTAGGKSVTWSTGYPQIVNGQAVARFDDLAWTSSSITARGALFYNSSKSDRAIIVLDFGVDQSSTAGTFTLKVPATASPIIVLA